MLNFENLNKNLIKMVSVINLIQIISTKKFIFFNFLLYILINFLERGKMLSRLQLRHLTKNGKNISRNLSANSSSKEQKSEWNSTKNKVKWGSGFAIFMPFFFKHGKFPKKFKFLF